MSNLKEKTTGGTEPHLSRLPYVAPWIEMRLVELDGGIAANSARIKGDPNTQFRINDYANPNADETLGDIEF